MNRATVRDNPPVALLVLGVATGVSQALLLREAMAAMGGSELAWGTVMSLWLAGMALGSRAGARVGGPRMGSLLPLATVLLAGLGIVLFRAAPELVGSAPGETLTAWHAAWLWAAAVLPAAVAGGLAFPILAARPGSGGAGSAYALEASGALVGGLTLSLALAPLGTAPALCLTASFVTAASTAVTWRPLRWTVTVLLAVAALFAGDVLAAASWKWAGHPGRLAHWLESRHQRVEISSGDPVSMYADGRLVATYPDPYSTVPRAHLLMLFHPNPRRVFSLGALADGSVVTMASHPVTKLMVVEEDPQLAERLPEWYGPDLETALADQTTELRTTDPIKALADSGPWDVIVLLDGNPITVRHGRTRTLEFFQLCRRRMADDGILVLRLQLSDTYLGGSAGRLLDIMAATLRAVFPCVAAVPGEDVLLIAGGPEARLDLRPSTLAHRWRERRVADPLFGPEMIELLLDPSRSEALNETVAEASAPANTRDHPRAVLVAAGLLEARSRPFLLGWSRALEYRSPTPLAAAAGVLILCLLILGWRRRPPATAAAAVVGGCSMGWWLLLMAAWQSTRGSVYAEVGALSAAFMGGLASGSLVAARWARPAAHLPWVLGGGCALSVVLATPAMYGAPTLLIPFMLAAGGFLTGMAFPGIAALAGRGDTRRGAAMAFAADEAGAAAAPILVGILALPWAGTRLTATGLAALLAAAALSLVMWSRRQGTPGG